MSLLNITYDRCTSIGAAMHYILVIRYWYSITVVTLDAFSRLTLAATFRNLSEIAVFSTVANERIILISRHLRSCFYSSYSIELNCHRVFNNCSCTGFTVWSFSESRAQTLISARPLDMIRVNRTRLSRIYPASYRVNSGNFNPIFYWNSGCQLGEFSVLFRSCKEHIFIASLVKISSKINACCHVTGKRDVRIAATE